MKNALLLAASIALFAAPVFAEQPGLSDNGPHIRKMSEFMFSKMDADGNGYITKDEMRAYADKMFDEADRSHTGKVTIDDLVNEKLKERTEFQDWEGKNTSDTSSASKLKSN